VRRALDELITTLRPTAPAARWVRPENIHVTLKFIGEVPPAQLRPICDRLTEIRLPVPVRVSYGRLGFFPNDHHPRVFWAGIHASDSLAALAASIERSLESLSIARESRAFKPHLTLARFSEPHPAPKLFEAVVSLQDAEFGDTVSSEFHLFESRLKPGGPEYACLATFAFLPEESAGTQRADG
jgi:2'-5' RNA ligase